MWFLLSLVLLAPVGWVLAGAPGLDGVPAPAVGTGPLVAALLVGVVFGVGRARPASTHLSTVAHEFGHGLAAALLGGRVTRIRLAFDGSGAAYTAFPTQARLRQLIVAGAGYVTPGLLAVASVQAVVAGVAAAWVAYLVLVVAVMLVLVVRSWWGLLVAVLLAAAGVGLVLLATGVVTALVVSALAGALAGGGLVDAIAQWRGRGRLPRSDARSMARLSRLPVGLFAGLHVLLASALGVATVALLL